MLSTGLHFHTEQDIPLDCGCTVDIRYDKDWDPISGFLANICNDHLPPPESNDMGDPDWGTHGPTGN